jgi:hypothetical protein
MAAFLGGTLPELCVQTTEDASSFARRRDKDEVLSALFK